MCTIVSKGCASLFRLNSVKMLNSTSMCTDTACVSLNSLQETTMAAASASG